MGEGRLCRNQLISARSWREGSRTLLLKLPSDHDYRPHMRTKKLHFRNTLKAWMSWFERALIVAYVH
jgi:hypothetical protein